MLKFCSAAVLALALFGSTGVAETQTHHPYWVPPPPGGSKIVAVNMTEPMPAKINLRVGDKLVFYQGPQATFDVKPTDKQGILLVGQPHNPFDQRAVYSALRRGAGEITITYNVQTPGHKPIRPVTIQVQVR